MKSKIIILISLMFNMGILNADITGVGYATTKSVAKKEALADLSQSIKSEVRSEFKSISTDEGSNAKENIKISSNLPILGAEFRESSMGEEFEVNVNLSQRKVGKLYTKKLQTINSEVDSILVEIDKISSSSLKLKLYENLYSLLKDYDRYESVAIILEAKLENRPNITKSKVKSEMAKLSSKIDSLNMATEVLAKSFKQKGIFLYPPLALHSTTVAEFGSVFLQEFKGKLKTSASLSSASYILVGEYTLTKKVMILNYELIDTKTNEVVNSKTININAKAYAGIKTKPKGMDFDALLNSGIVTSSDLKVSLKSNKGSENLLFKENEEVKLLIKLNKMGYIYIVGYTQTKDTKVSYLLELSEGDGDSKFIKFINADDANRWISLGEFVIAKPFGIESLQIIASNKKINSLLPSTKYDEESEYYIVSKDIKKALVKTRGMHKKKSKKVEMSEDVISFTTMK